MEDVSEEVFQKVLAGFKKSPATGRDTLRFLEQAEKEQKAKDND